MLFVIPSPGRDASADFSRRTEPVLIEAFIPKLAIEGLNEGITRGLAKLDRLQLDVVMVGPRIKRLAGEFTALVGADRPG